MKVPARCNRQETEHAEHHIGAGEVDEQLEFRRAERDLAAENRRDRQQQQRHDKAVAIEEIQRTPIGVRRVPRQARIARGGWLRIGPQRGGNDRHGQYT